MMTAVAMPAAGGLTRGGRTSGKVSGRRLGKGNHAVKHRRLRHVRASASNPEEFIVGCGTGDVTGPIDGVGMMGYAKIGQVTRGMWQRQWARAFLEAFTSIVENGTMGSFSEITLRTLSCSPFSAASTMVFLQLHKYLIVHLQSILLNLAHHL